MDEYPFREVESRWQQFWNQIRLYQASHEPRKKFYLLEMFPYPSGSDLHMGHLKNYAIGDTVARVQIMKGYDVLHPMGWDAFGLPAENAAIKYGIHPNEWTKSNIKAYAQHLKLLGLSYDWDREIATCDPKYYRWTQWLFLYLYHRGLAYRADDYVNYCPQCKTVLANEQVIAGVCERCHAKVEKRLLKQWYFRITAYAERLLSDLSLITGTWPESVIKQQMNWIGRSEGTEIVFTLINHGEIRLPVFTTRADTLFGVTFLTMAPEHPLLESLLPYMDSTVRNNVHRYREQAILKSDIDRTAVDKRKSGIFTGLFTRHPFLSDPIPLWIGDYVLAQYGTGIVMGVPAHDQRDFEFARAFNLPIRPVIRPYDGSLADPGTLSEAFTEYGIMENSGTFTGLESTAGIKALQEELKRRNLGGFSITYRLRDWLVSRQRYWGAPIPIIHCNHCDIVPVPESELPVFLPPDIQNFKPTGRSPLEDMEAFINTLCPRCHNPAQRDPDTMDTFVDSSWYFLRFTDPHNEDVPFDPACATQWMPVDQYIGGAEHATKHLIYARFITKVLYDGGLLPTPEPFRALFTQGLVLKKFYWCPSCLRAIADNEVEQASPTAPVLHRNCEHEAEERLEMMSKSRGNIVPVGPFIEEYGADVARIAIMFAGPADKDFEWTQAIVDGARNFLTRIWRLYMEYPCQHVDQLDPKTLQGDALELYIKIQKTIQNTCADLENFRYNTAIAALMTLLNEMYSFSQKEAPVFSYSFTKFVLLLAPLAPHLAEELWHRMGNVNSVFHSSLPTPDPNYMETDRIEIPIQVNGRLRGTIILPRDINRDVALSVAENQPNVQKYLQNKRIHKVVFVPNRLINFVVSDS